jgi:predicted RNase H-like nuclease (RuvC/YqgF family)
VPKDGCEDAIKVYAADLIENQQRHIEALTQANAALRDTVLRRDAQIEKMSEGLAQFAKAVAVEEEQSELHAMKNELCQYCGKYKHAHEGACDGCRWREM